METPTFIGVRLPCAAELLHVQPASNAVSISAIIRQFKCAVHTVVNRAFATREYSELPAAGRSAITTTMPKHYAAAMLRMADPILPVEDDRAAMVLESI